MPNDLQSQFDRDIATFMERLPAKNYKPQTIKAYRVLLKRLVSLIEAAGISPQDLTAERAPSGRSRRYRATRAADHRDSLPALVHGLLPPQPEPRADGAGH